MDLVANFTARSSCDFKYLCANSVKDGWKITCGSRQQKWSGRCLLHIHFITVATNRKELNAERSGSILTHLGGPQWVSEGREESGERRKRPRAHLANVVVFQWDWKWNVLLTLFTTPTVRATSGPANKKRSRLKLQRRQSCVSVELKGATPFGLSRPNLCCSKYDVSPVT